ncbi:MAG: amidohydrolase [Saccharofermentans sp.]|nr:amidohydrolase [Saccharofermentans sp.]
MRTRYYNALILTGESKDVREGEMWVTDDRIEAVVFDGRKSEELFDAEYDCGGDLLMPSLKDAHTHTAMTFSRSLADEFELNEWLFKAIFPREAKLTAEHVYWFTLLGFAENIMSGTTACFDMYMFPESVAKAAVESGIRNVFCGSPNDFGGMDLIEERYLKFNEYDPLVSYKMGFHAEYTTNKDNLKIISDLAHKYKAPVYTHISETRSEVDGCIERYGKTPAVVLDEMGMFDFGGGGFHCVHFTDEDIEVFKKRGLYTVFNACSNLKLSSGIAPVKKYIDAGLKIAIGTDGAGSNNSLDMFREMYLDAVLSNVRDDKNGLIDPFEILKAGYSGGAHCMGLTDSDILAAGKNADFILLDMHHPNMNPRNNIVSNIVYAASPVNVLMTVCAGKVLYHKGELTTIDIKEVNKMCNRLVEDLI